MWARVQVPVVVADVVGVGGVDLDVVHRLGVPGGSDADHAGGGSVGVAQDIAGPQVPGGGEAPALRVQGVGGGEPSGPAGGVLWLVVARPVDGVRPFFDDPTHCPPGRSGSPARTTPISTSSSPIAVILPVITTSTKPGTIQSRSITARLRYGVPYGEAPIRLARARGRG